MQEFLAGTLNLATLNKAENLKAAFESFDIDGDGKITREELQAGLKVGLKADGLLVASEFWKQTLPRR